MARERIHLRRAGGPRNNGGRMGWRPVLFFVVLAALVTILGIMREDALRKLAPVQSYPKQDERQ